MNFLKGRKTFIVAILVFLPGLFEFLVSGSFSFGSILGFLESQQVALLATTLRLGIGNK